MEEPQKQPHQWHPWKKFTHASGARQHLRAPNTITKESTQHFILLMGCLQYTTLLARPVTLQFTSASIAKRHLMMTVILVEPATLRMMVERR